MRPIAIRKQKWTKGRGLFVCLCVCLSVSHVRQLCKNDRTARDAVCRAKWREPKEPCIIWGRDPQEGQFSGFYGPLKSIGAVYAAKWIILLRRLISSTFRPSACQLSVVAPSRMLVLRSGTAYQMMSPLLRPCQHSGAIWKHTYSAAVTTLTDIARTKSDYSGPRGSVAD